MGASETDEKKCDPPFCVGGHGKMKVRFCNIGGRNKRVWICPLMNEYMDRFVEASIVEESKRITKKVLSGITDKQVLRALKFLEETEEVVEGEDEGGYVTVLGKKMKAKSVKDYLKKNCCKMAVDPMIVQALVLNLKTSVRDKVFAGKMSLIVPKADKPCACEMQELNGPTMIMTYGKNGQKLAVPTMMCSRGMANAVGEEKGTDAGACASWYHVLKEFGPEGVNEKLFQAKPMEELTKKNEEGYPVNLELYTGCLKALKGTLFGAMGKKKGAKKGADNKKWFASGVSYKMVGSADEESEAEVGSKRKASTKAIKRPYKKKKTVEEEDSDEEVENIGGVEEAEAEEEDDDDL